MARPIKRRRICAIPKDCGFLPMDGTQGTSVTLTVDEYEVIRLIDLCSLTQEECATRMAVARTTIQSIYDSARRKLALALCEHKGVTVRGGEVSPCPYAARCTAPTKQPHRRSSNMKIAVTYENGQVFAHFGHTEQFKVYTVENGAIVGSSVLDAAGFGHGALAGFLKQQGVDTLICGGIGGGARVALAEAGITLYPGAMGDADTCVANLLAGKLQYDPNTICSHHHHEAGQSSGHGCGEDKHGCGGK